MTTLHVDAAGNGDFTTIQAAINAASDGDIIVVAAGIYSDFVDVNKSVTIQGANQGMDGQHGRGAESVLTGGVKISAANATIDGVQIDGRIERGPKPTA